jgi:hypothetical protein
MKAKETAEALAAAHWGYIGEVLTTHAVPKMQIENIGFHYRTAMIHGFKHGVEWERDRADEEAFFDAAINHVAMEAELDRSCGDPAQDIMHHNFTMRKFQLCPSCARTSCAKGEYPATKDGGCEGYISALRERVLDAKEEAPFPYMGCATTDCCNHSISYLRNCAAYLPGAMRQCVSYTTAKQEPPTAAGTPLNFTLPSIALKCTAEEAWKKFESELKEWRAAELGSAEELIERWDCLQALQTFYERGGNVTHYQTHVGVIMHDLAKWHSMGRAVMVARAAMVVKNARRNYYAPEVNAAIIASNGASFTP